MTPVAWKRLSLGPTDQNRRDNTSALSWMFWVWLFLGAITYSISPFHLNMNLTTLLKTHTSCFCCRGRGLQSRVEFANRAVQMGFSWLLVHSPLIRGPFLKPVPCTQVCQKQQNWQQAAMLSSLPGPPPHRHHLRPCPPWPFPRGQAVMAAFPSLQPLWDAGAGPRLSGASCDFPAEVQQWGGMGISKGVSAELTDPIGISHLWLLIHWLLWEQRETISQHLWADHLPVSNCFQSCELWAVTHLHRKKTPQLWETVGGYVAHHPDLVLASVSSGFQIESRFH